MMLWSGRSFAQQDVLVPWHLGDHHVQGDTGDDREETPELSRTCQALGNGNTLPSSSPPLHSDVERTATGEQLQLREYYAAVGVKRCGDGNNADLDPDEVVPCETSSIIPQKRVEALSAPAPKSASHGVRLHGVAGACGSVVYQRYCHVYEEGELEGLVRKIRSLKVLDSYYDKSNWCILAERC